MPQSSKIRRMIPYFILTLLLLFTWFRIIFYDGVLGHAQTISLFLHIITGMLLYFRFPWGIIFNGLVLILAAVSIVKVLPFSFNFSYSFYINSLTLRNTFIDNCLITKSF